MSPYLKLPLSLAAPFTGGMLAVCSLEESIMRNLHLLITSAAGENKQDPRHGAAFWAYDYDVHLPKEARKQIIKSSLLKQIQDYEPRITNVSLAVEIKEAEFQSGACRQLRRRIEIIVSAALVHSGEDFRFPTGFFIGPLSFD